jgi:transcriptional regulator with XRE-family HTH domain
MYPAITGDDIRAMRLGVGYSRRNLARRMHCSVSQLKRWENETPFMPDDVVPLFLDVVMAAMAEHDELVHLALVVSQKLLRSRSKVDPNFDLKPSSSVS